MQKATKKEDKIKARKKQLSKSLCVVVDWKWFQGKEGQVIPEMTTAYIESVSERYIELYENILGENLSKQISIILITALALMFYSI
jgi:phosphoribosylaminoimidazole-succinocarboxamide synthase